MASVRHPNVISYLGVCAEPACIVTEYCSKGSLTDVLRRGRASLAHRAALDWPRRLNMAMDAAKVTNVAPEKPAGWWHLHVICTSLMLTSGKSMSLLEVVFDADKSLLSFQELHVWCQDSLASERQRCCAAGHAAPAPVRPAHHPQGPEVAQPAGGQALEAEGAPFTATFDLLGCSACAVL